VSPHYSNPLKGKKMKKHILLAAALVVTATGTAQAQILDGWSGEASLTGSKTTGNTDTTDIGLGLKGQKEAGLWRHKFKALADQGKADGITNKKRYNLGYQIDRDFTDRLYGYANADYFSDDFGAFQEGYFAGGGLGYKVILPDPVSWNVEGGLGYRSQEEQGAFGVTNNEIAGRAFSDFDFILNDNVSLYNDTELLYSESDTYIWNETGITATLAGNLAARASFRVDNHSNVPVGREKTDTITRFGIVYTMN
jgi:putative salt-induced outer membrane protein